MHQETIAGLHKCQPKNAPEAGTIKNMVVLNMPARNGKKAWIKIKSEKPEKGGSPYRILNVEKLDWPPDDYGNVAFNIEVEAANGQPSTFQQTKAAMSSETHTQQGESQHENGDGVSETRRHLMQSANLLVLCIRAAEKAVSPHQPVVAQTSEQFQSDVAKLFIEASGRRTTDGVNWWSYIDKMPVRPIE